MQLLQQCSKRSGRRRSGKSSGPSHRSFPFRKIATSSLISNPSKDILRTLLNRLKCKVEKLLTEDQAGFRVGWSRS
ncbi:hypothetical protein DPMN_158918 [Dreissena polymorpha]|uniref:Uncharacterized protein n=1 Tax=Dreissena polymorpha TaxID=45954 RepID=A0A9D4EKQ5_DREPO|nr:hypothetical protein DPMN_158918 [Dreissena polymorpha]